MGGVWVVVVDVVVAVVENSGSRALCGVGYGRGWAVAGAVVV